ncbi:hypothetical protein C9E81_21705, partial [Paracoccus alkanivorans]
HLPGQRQHAVDERASRLARRPISRTEISYAPSSIGLPGKTSSGMEVRCIPNSPRRRCGAPYRRGSCSEMMDDCLRFQHHPACERTGAGSVATISSIAPVRAEMG